jgi:hypothetical protein
METNKQLFTILTTIGEVHSCRWRSVVELVDYIQNNKATKITKSKWEDIWGNNKDFKNISTWSTHDLNIGRPSYYNCIDLRYTVKNNKLHCEAKIYNGDICNGERLNLRFSASVVLPIEFISTLNKSIMLSFDKYVKDEYDSYLELKKNNWINNYKKEFFKENV